MKSCRSCGIRRGAAALTVALVCFLPSGPLSAGDWPMFRGPTGMGITEVRDLPLTWGGAGGENVVWKVPLPGVAPGATSDHNQSSPIVWRDRVFTTTGIWPAGREQKEFPDQHVACLDLADGKTLWDVTI